MAVIPPIVTATSLLTKALQRAGVAASGETPDAAMLTEALDTLNFLIDWWGLNRLTIFQTPRNVYNLVSGTQTYTIGPGGTFNQVRPLWIPYAGIVSQVTAPYPLETPLAIWGEQEWASISTKTNIKSPIPEGIYYDYGFSTPTPGGLGSIAFWPTPSFSGTLQFAIYCPTPLTGFADLTTQYAFPPGYVDTICDNVAVKLAQEWGRPKDDVLIAKAADELHKLKTSNFRPARMGCDDALTSNKYGGASNYNIYNDTYGR